MALKLALNEGATPPQTESTQIGLVDQLRGLAILLVLFDHLFGINFRWVLPWVNGVRDFGAYGYESVFIHLFYLGWAGVPLFFVLSGFCIHWSCLRWDQFEIGRFFWLRFWRIYPAYFLALIIFSAFKFRRRFDPTDWQFLSHLFLFHNFSGSTFWGINGPFWSIAVEMQLYLLYPILLVIKQRAGWRGCFLVAGSLSLIWRVIAVSAWGLPDDGITPAMASPLNTWVDWTLGAWIAEAYRIGRRAFPASRALPLVILVCFVVSTIYRPLVIFSFFLASLASALWLDKMLNRKASGKDRTPGLLSHFRKQIVWYGLVSYSLYIWHEPILIRWHAFFEKYASNHFSRSIYVPLSVGVSGLAATMIAYFSFRFLEKPGIHLGRLLLTRLTSSELRRRSIAAPQLEKRKGRVDRM